MKDQATLRLWLEGARPKTIPAAIVPVLVGTAASTGSDLRLSRFVLALIVSMSLQIGVNYANDYSDGIRGTDENRIGPRRLVASQLVSSQKVKRAALVAFLVAAIAGLVLAVSISLWILLVGFAAIVAAWFYTGGSKPYGYLGYGEVSVFVFFGLVATSGSAFVQSERIEALPVWCAIPIGFLATALLVINNLRDIETDIASAKKTLAVRVGEKATRQLYAFLLIGAVVAYGLIGVIYCYKALAALTVAPFAIKLSYQICVKTEGVDLINVLESTAKIHLISGILFTLGLSLGL